MASIYPGGFNGYSYGASPALARRASGYFVFVTGGGGAKMILLNDDGSIATVRASVGGQWPLSVYSPSTRSTVVMANVRLDDQGNTLAVATGSFGGGATGLNLNALAEDSQGSIITISTGYNNRGSGGNGVSYYLMLNRLNSNLEVTPGQNVYIPQASYNSGHWSIMVAPNGQYIIAGGPIVPGGLPALTVAALPAYAPLAAKPATLRAGTLGLYPNPAAGSITVQQPAGQAGTVGIYDGLGRRCGAVQPVPAGAVASVTLPQLAPGVYVVRFTTRNGQTYTDRLTVQ
jgi:hypothetical protein